MSLEPNANDSSWKAFVGDVVEIPTDAEPIVESPLFMRIPPPDGALNESKIE